MVREARKRANQLSAPIQKRIGGTWSGRWARRTLDRALDDSAVKVEAIRAEEVRLGTSDFPLPLVLKRAGDRTSLTQGWTRLHVWGDAYSFSAEYDSGFHETYAVKIGSLFGRPIFASMDSGVMGGSLHSIFFRPLATTTHRFQYGWLSLPMFRRAQERHQSAISAIVSRSVAANRQ